MSDIDITIYVNGKWHAQRRWPSVPRIGDKIVVQDGEKGIIVKVKDIIWGALEEDVLGYQACQVNLHCKY